MPVLVALSRTLFFLRFSVATSSFLPRKRAKTASYSYRLSQLVSFLECGGGFNAEIAGRLSALWRDGEFLPAHALLLQCNLYEFKSAPLLLHFSADLLFCCRSLLPSQAQPFLRYLYFPDDCSVLVFFMYPPFQNSFVNLLQTFLP